MKKNDMNADACNGREEMQIKNGETDENVKVTEKVD